MYRIVVVDDTPENLAAARTAAAEFPDFAFVFCATMTEALEYISQGVAGVVTDCFLPREESPEVEAMYQSYLRPRGESLVRAASGYSAGCADNYLRRPVEETAEALADPARFQAYGAALLMMLQRADVAHHKSRKLEGRVPCVLVTDLHRHGTDSGDLESVYNGLVLLAPLLRCEGVVSVRGLLTEEEIVSDGAHSIHYVGSDQIHALARKDGKADPVVWIAAYHRLMLQVETAEA